LRRALRDLSLDLNAFLFPRACIICRAGLPPRWPVAFCAGCRRRLVSVPGPTCLLCRTADRDGGGFTAGRRCRDPEHQRYLCYAAVQMIDPADRLVHALKFHDRPEVGPALALLVARRLRSEEAASWDRVLPMPLHPTRERARGYNQSREIAVRLARSLGAVHTDRLLVRARSTRAQADLDHAERADNVAGAFRLRSGPSRRSRTRPGSDGASAGSGRDRRSRSVEGLRCLIVDDVATTGNTLVEAIKALEAGSPVTTAAAVFALA
jgi:predicted amidophosphoribosyltransferase